MNITVIFSDSGDSAVPDGASLTFEDVDDYTLHTTRGIVHLDCAAAGCEGCNYGHRTLSGSANLELKASGLHKNGPRWKFPEVTG